MFKNHTNIVEQLKFNKKNKVRLVYLGIFILWVFGYFLIKKIDNNSEANIYFVFGLVFALFSFVTALFIANDREKTLQTFKIGMAGYILYICLFEALMLAAGYGKAEVGDTAMVLKAICTYSRAIIPLGLILWQAQKWKILFGGRKSKMRTIEDLKNHGNDGLN